MVSKKTKTSGINPLFETSIGTLDVLADIAASNKLSTEDITNMYADSYKVLEDKGVKENLEILAVNGVKNMVRKLTKKATFEPKAKAVGLVGFVIGDSGLWDKIKQMRDKITKYVEKNGLEAAVQANLINGDNQVLDQREKLFGKENINYLEPIEKTVNGKVIKVVDKTRTLHLIARLNGSKEYKYGTIQTNDPSLAVGWGKVKKFIPCQTFGIIKEDPEGVNGFKLNSSQAEDTTSIFKAIKDEMDVDKIFMDTISKDIEKVSEVEKFHEAYKDVYGATIFVKGIVAWINRDRPSPFGSIKMGLMDEDTGDIVVVSIPEQVTADFGEQSVVVVLGRTDRQDLRDIDENGKTTWTKDAGDVAINAVGIYPVKGLVTPTDLNRPEVLEDEREIEGWVD